MLIKTIDEVKRYVAVASNLDIDSLMPDLTDVEQRHILPILDITTYNALQTAYDNNTLATEQEQLLKKIQKAISNIALEQYSSLAQLDFSDSGIRQMQSDTHVAAKQWQIDDIRVAFFMKGYRAMDDVLAYLEQEKVYFATWAASPNYTVNKKFIVSDANTFNLWHNIEESRKTFISLMPSMRIVETLKVKKQLGTALYNRVKAEILSGTISTDIANVLELLQPAVVKWTIMKAIDEKILTIMHDGLYVRNSKADFFSNREKLKTDAQERQYLRDAVEKDAESFIVELKNYLNTTATATVLPEYFNDASVYVAPIDNSVQYPSFENDCTAKVYFA